MTVSLELEDIQALVVRGYGHLPAACFVLLEIHNADTARGWLGALADEVTPGHLKPEDRSLNIAFTHRGLERLGLVSDLLSMFC